MPDSAGAELHLLNARGDLDALADAIHGSFRRCVAKVQTLITLHALDVVVYADRSHAIPEVGFGGHSPSAARAFVAIDPDRAFDAEGFERCLAHELHHCVRWRLIGYGRTLGAAIVSEGLACRFEVEVAGEGAPIYATTLSEAELAACVASADKLLEAPSYNHAEWFFGQGALPRFAGYAIGYRLVTDTCKRLGLSAAQLVGRPYIDFFEETGWSTTVRHAAS